MSLSTSAAAPVSSAISELKTLNVDAG